MRIAKKMIGIIIDVIVVSIWIVEAPVLIMHYAGWMTFSNRTVEISWIYVIGIPTVYAFGFIWGRHNKIKHKF